MKKVLAVAGSDTSGGAGLQADLKAFHTQKVYGMIALTVIVAQTADKWEHQVFPMNTEIVEQQLKTIFDGIGIDAMKTGMLGSVDLINLVAKYIDKYQPKLIVVDPVLACKGDNEVMNSDVATALREIMVPRAYVLTPNLLEAGIMSGMGKLSSIDDIKQATVKMYEKGAKHIVVKGFPSGNKMIDVVYDGEEHILLENPLIDAPYNHGAGCTFAATIAALLAKDNTAIQAIKTAHKVVFHGIQNGFKLNDFTGCLNYTTWTN